MKPIRQWLAVALLAALTLGLAIVSADAQSKKVIRINHAGADDILGTEHQMFAWIFANYVNQRAPTLDVRLFPNSGLGPYCVAKYGVVALAEVLYRELREFEIGVSVLCPMRVGTNIGQSERNRQTDYGETAVGARVADQDAGNADLAGRVIEVDGVAALTVDAIEQNRLYVLPHEESRASIRRRFERIDRTFESQPAM